MHNLKNTNMKNLEKLSLVAFEILDKNNEVIEKMGELADIGFWLSGPDSATEITFLPSDSDEIKRCLKEKDIEYFPVKITPLDTDNGFEEKPEESFMGVWFEEISLPESKEIAKNLKLDYLFFSNWDGDRLLGIFDVNSDDEIIYGYTNE